MSAIDESREEIVPIVEPPKKESADERRRLPIFDVLDKIDFSDHFVLIWDVGTGKSTVTPIHEFERS